MILFVRRWCGVSDKNQMVAQCMRPLAVVRDPHFLQRSVWGHRRWHAGPLSVARGSLPLVSVDLTSGSGDNGSTQMGSVGLVDRLGGPH
jgi:hypothetical protein